MNLGLIFCKINTKQYLNKFFKKKMEKMNFKIQTGGVLHYICNMLDWLNLF